MGKAKARRRKPPITLVGPKIGYDGQEPQFLPARDITGGGRRKIDGIQNIKVDRLEWMLAKEMINPHHHTAGRKLQDLWQVAEISVGMRLVGGGAGAPSSSLSDAKCDAMAAIGKVREALSPMAWRVVELVVIENKGAGDAAKIMGFHERAAMPNLMHGLDALARHFKLC